MSVAEQGFQYPVRERAAYNMFRNRGEFESKVMKPAFEKAALKSINKRLARNSHSEPETIHSIGELNHLKDLATAVLTRVNFDTDSFEKAEINWNKNNHKPVLQLSTHESGGKDTTQVFIFESPFNISDKQNEASHVYIHVHNGKSDGKGRIKSPEIDQLVFLYPANSNATFNVLEPAILQLDGQGIRSSLSKDSIILNATNKYEDSEELLRSFQEKLEAKRLWKQASQFNTLMLPVRELSTSGKTNFDSLLLHDALNLATAAAGYSDLIHTVYPADNIFALLDKSNQLKKIAGRQSTEAYSQVPTLLEELNALITPEVKAKYFKPGTMLEPYLPIFEYLPTAAKLSHIQYDMMQYLKLPTPDRLDRLTQGTGIGAKEILRKFIHNEKDSQSDFKLNPSDAHMFYAIASKLDGYNHEYTVRKNDYGEILFECPWTEKTVPERFVRYANPIPRPPESSHKFLFDYLKSHDDFSPGLYLAEIIGSATNKDIQAQVEAGKLTIGIFPLKS